jgi:hypothetical protein
VKGAIESVSPLGLAFFGLTSDNIAPARASLFSQIHQIVFYGKGGYDWHTVYNMPIFLRLFTFNEIKKHYEEEKESIENNRNPTGGKKTVINSDGTIKTPELLQKPVNAKFPTKYS